MSDNYVTGKPADMYEDGEHGDALAGQLQYTKYVKCHVYRIHPCTFGVTRTKGCGDTFDNGGGGSCGGGGGGQTGHDCIGPGDPGMPGAGGSFSYQEVYNDQAPCMDFESVCVPYDYRFDMMRGNHKIDHGDINDIAWPCTKGSWSPRNVDDMCYSYNYSDPYNPNYNG